MLAVLNKALQHTKPFDEHSGNYLHNPAATFYTAQKCDATGDAAGLQCTVQKKFSLMLIE